MPEEPSSQHSNIPPPVEVLMWATVSQAEELAQQGALTPAELEQARQAGGLRLRVDQAVLEQHALEQNATHWSLQRVATRLQELGLASPARLMLSAGKPLSLVSSSLLLLFQPVVRLGWGNRLPVTEISQLLEDRQNWDKLIAMLDTPAQAGSASRAANPIPKR